MAEPFYRAHVLTCAGTGCSASGSLAVHNAMEEEVRKRGLADEVKVIPTGCRGFCSMGPVMIIYPDGIFYCQVQAEDVPEIVEETLVKGRVVGRLLYREPESLKGLPYYHEIPFYGKQLRIALRNCGFINPEEITEYIACGGYEALGKVLREMSPTDVLDTMKRSGLRGRGGAGFLTGLKWELTRRAPGDVKYVICNADEGDPGAFMDRSVLEGDPHSVVEGMAIGAYAIGAQEGFIYCRAEYPLAIHRLKIAIKQAEEYGLLGEDIMGSGFSFKLHIKEGAGAFVCGEETALIASIEGRRGEPRPRPPFPSVSGLWGKPTNINNVETWANVAPIISRGAEWFASIGTERSKGTKVFALTGRVNNVGLVEVPMGITVGDIVYDIGGGIPHKKQFKAVQTGGPLGGCLPVTSLNTPVDYDSLTSAGATMGSGGMIVVDEDTCMVEFAKFFLTFAQDESCGQCTPCRIGGKRMLEILTRITQGEGKLEDLDRLEELARVMANTSLCALGQLTPSPVMSTLRHFRDEYIAHIVDKRCPAGVCDALVIAKCHNACPLGTNVPLYTSLIAEGRFDEALAVVKQDNPFPGICGRVCVAECEAHCRRGQIDSPVAVRQLKRFLADWELQQAGKVSLGQPVANKREEKVAVIGAGPAGLTAAYYLAKDGFPVTVFEALPVAGGMLAVGIPEYRLPREILDVEIDAIKALGVEIVTNTRFGSDVTLDDLLTQGYSAVLISTGAHGCSKLGIPGEEMEGVIAGVDFLREVNLGQRRSVGERVVVVGGGNVAIDAARSALRLGAKEVHVVYRRQRDDMPAHEQEIKDAEDEGIQFHYLTNPVRVLGADWKMTGVECQKMMLGEFDRSGRRRPLPITGSEFVIEADMLITAIGQVADLSCLPPDDGVVATRHGTIAVNPKTLVTGRMGVFAAGDVVTGPATVIEAIAQGREAAVSISRYLQGEDLSAPRERKVELPTEGLPVPEGEVPRVEAPRLDPTERKHSFAEVEGGFTAEMARREAARCLRCYDEHAKKRREIAKQSVPAGVR